MRAVVIGAGVTGLTAAVALRRAGAQVRVLESADRPGGPVRTVLQDGFVLEQGPQSVRGGAPEVAALLEALRLRDRVVRASPESAARHLWQGGRLLPVGGSPALLRRLLRRRDLARLFLEPLVPRGGSPDETLRAFVERRIGRGASDALLDAVIGGIFGGDPGLLEARTALARPWRWEREHGSLARGALAAPPPTEPRGSFTFPRGLQELVDALAAEVGPDLAVDQPATRVEQVGAGWRVHTRGGERLEADRLVLTCPPAVAGALWPPLAPPPLPTARVVAIHLAFDVREVSSPPRGFGWLAHPRERTDALGCLYVSSTFPSHAPANRHLLRVMVGGARDPGAADLADAPLVDRALRVVAEVQGLRAAPALVQVSRPAPIPQYPPGWGAFLDRARGVPGLDCAGWSWGGIGLADGISAAWSGARAREGRGPLTAT